MDDAAATPTHPEQSPGVKRRDLIKGGALVTGTAWVSPVIYDSVTNPAAAAGCGSSDLPQTFANPGDYTVYVAADTPVYYDVRGGGGGSGGWGSQNGGA